jgi:hypothetical protein
MKKHLRTSLAPFIPCSIHPFRLFLLLSLFSLLSVSEMNAQSCQDASVEVSATVQADPPRITLNWVANAGASQYFVYRKLKTGTSWGAVIGSFDGTATQFIDSTVNVGVSYEYRITRQAANYTGFGYINAGIEVPAVHSRGILILVVDQSMVDSLAYEIERFKSDLAGDGWRVVQHNVSRTATVTSVKALIVGTYNLDKPNTKAVLLLGRIPVPYSGQLYPDGHPDHEGAWPADVYYADMNGTWTDNSVNTTVANDERHHNTPGDGNFDQSILPTEVELQLGRVDFAKMPAFATSEQELLRNYLDKDHAYRHKQFSAIRRGVVDDNFGFFGTEAFAASGYKNFGPLVGPENVKSDDYFATTADSSYLWAYGCGGGWYQGAGGIGSTGDFANANLQSVFSMLFGSYFGDWDSQDNFLRAPLAQGTTLTNAWSGRPHWLLHHMGLGENIGYSARLTQNNNSLYFFSYGARFVHIALMGDPTLRNDVVAPAGNVTVTDIGPYNQLTWSPSPEPVLGYHVYFKGEGDTEFVLLNETPHPDIAYTHDCVADTGLLTYMVRAVKLQQSPSGTYYNLSQGVTDTITGTGIPEVDALASWEIISDDVVFTNLSLNASSFAWSFGDGEFSSEANPTHNYQDGFFNGNLIATNGCDADTFYFDVLIFTGVKDITDDPSISVSPNPTSGRFKLSWTDLTQDAVGVKIYSLAGKEVFGKDAIVNGTEIDLSGIPAGMYVMHVLKGGVRSMKRVVVQ